MPTDLELLYAWRDGDRDAGNTLVNRHFRCVYGFFRTKVDGACDDLIQRTFLRCVESLDRFRGESSFRTYLFAIARNELYGYYRRRARGDARLDFTSVSVVDLCASPSAVVVQQQEELLLLRALRRLPIDYQIALELYYWDGLKGRQLAEVLEIPEGTVRTWLRRARLALDDLMGELADDRKALTSTVDNLEHWARSLRQRIRAHDNEAMA